MVQRLHWLQRNWGQWELVKYSVQTNESAFLDFGAGLKLRFKRLQMEMPLSAPENWLEWTKTYFRCQIYSSGRANSPKKDKPKSTSLWFVAFWKFSIALGEVTTAVSVFVKSTNITTNIKTAALSSFEGLPKLSERHKVEFALLYMILCIGPKITK